MNPEISYSLANVTLPKFPLWTALVTPFAECGAIDFASLSRIARQQAATGNGLLLLGSTGEALSLSPEQQFGIVNYVVELNLNVPIMVGVGGFQLLQQLDWIERCNQLNIDAFLLGAPLYAKPGPVGQEQWFSALLNASDKPCMLYNVPSRSGVTLAVEALTKLQHHPKCWALKEASGNLSQFEQYRRACPNLVMYSGEDALMPELAVHGAQGLVSVAANAWPQATKLYVQQCLTHADVDRSLWQSAVATLFSVANPIPVKVLMHENGDIDSPALQLPLTHFELTDTQAIIAANDAIEAWYREQTSAPVTTATRRQAQSA
ncbi:4-hydroxy-tetrahydrodipicolinate synthase [Thalassotalea euphylliae]|uniref:4-hydroxy-tetrahydrodipicolinate synthase n=1 Tax=Thalassotalea euphylliae TaxID=1655234 RepID=A0A3E0TLW1_9GAMM|nr:4-hydroxy-tetrahydrodipicolinate synthase [Thalassotalea euphylliae]REL25549.1 4-hydroxy-tetrahydrodipicolinate synthase [Thalassotalea euphylliae]